MLSLYIPDNVTFICIVDLLVLLGASTFMKLSFEFLRNAYSNCSIKLLWFLDWLLGVFMVHKLWLQALIMHSYDDTFNYSSSTDFCFTVSLSWTWTVRTCFLYLVHYPFSFLQIFCFHTCVLYVLGLFFLCLVDKPIHSDY